jgi:phosphatidate cytidylyltransferase
MSAVVVVLLANWPAHLDWGGPGRPPFRDVVTAFAAVVLLAFLWEMANYREPGGVVVRLSLLVWGVAYLGLLPSFMAQLRWWPAQAGAEGPDLRGEAALALVFFVPKFGDIGAYFTGRLLGRHRMTPLLSPKKTWEGLAGGMVASMLIAVGINRLVSPVVGSDLQAALFGLVVGLAGVLGDLAESLIKRDGGQKDASRVVPGFGGILDVVDSVLFAAPVAWWWLQG